MAVKSVQAVIKGTTYELTYNSETGLYEGSVTAPGETSYNNNSEHYFPVTLKASDTAGNSTVIDDTNATFGNKLKLRVKEKTAPVISILSPTESQYLTENKPTITWNVTDTGSGVNPDTISITIGDGSKITGGIAKTEITDGYKCTYAISSALEDGTHTIMVDAQDYDGNNAVQRTVNFTIDTVPPTLSITSPANNLVTNNSKITVAGQTDDATSKPVSVTVKLNEADEQEVTVSSNGSFSIQLTLADGTNTIKIVATDAASKTTTVIRTVTLDTTAPVIGDVTITPNPVSTGEIIKIAVKVTD